MNGCLNISVRNDKTTTQNAVEQVAQNAWNEARDERRETRERDEWERERGGGTTTALHEWNTVKPRPAQAFTNYRRHADQKTRQCGAHCRSCFCCGCCSCCCCSCCGSCNKVNSSELAIVIVSLRFSHVMLQRSANCKSIRSPLVEGSNCSALRPLPPLLLPPLNWVILSC